MLNVIQIGFGPLGIRIADYIADKKNIKTVAVVDINPSLKMKSLNEISNKLSKNTHIYDTVEAAINSLDVKPVAAIITTVSSLEMLIPQIEEVAKFGIHVVSTCEELSYPWVLQPELSEKLDDVCKKYNIACLGTGVNPGFLMDYLPVVMSSICKDLDQIIVERVQDASTRRLPFQKKIGAGLNLEDFKKRASQGTIRHVGLKESVYLLANSIGFSLDNVSESLEPVIARENVSSKAIIIKKGDAKGVEQIAMGYFNGDLKIKMHFKAAVGELRSYDKITIKGIPSFSSEIEGGINGDIATCAIIINSIKSILKAPAGLRTMADINVPGFIN